MATMPPWTCEYKQKLLDLDIQVSAPRLAIAAYVLRTEDHPTADEVKMRVEKFFPMVSLATVYNTLKLFVEKGLLRSIQDDRTDAIRYDCNLEPHHHFLDEETGRMMDIPSSSVGIKTQLSQDYQVSSVDVFVRGRFKGQPHKKGS